jgi:hypothetical protein
MTLRSPLQPIREGNMHRCPTQLLKWCVLWDGDLGQFINLSVLINNNLRANSLHVLSAKHQVISAF